MNIIVKPLPDLNTTEYRACHYLNLRGEGMMMYSLMDNKTNERAMAVMLWDDAQTKLLGWALLIPHGDDYCWDSTAWQRKKSRYIAQFYVRKTHRGRGLGASLMDEVIRLDKTPTVIPHDRTSALFFASYEVVTERSRRGMITSAKKNKKPQAA